MDIQEIQDEINFSGYPVMFRENGMICTRTPLGDGKYLTCCQTDTNPPEPDKSDKWYSARELREPFDKLTDWTNALNCTEM